MGTPINQPACGDDYFVCELIYARSEAPAELVNLPQVQRGWIQRIFAYTSVCSQKDVFEWAASPGWSRLRARAPRNSGLALAVDDEADYDSEAYHDVWAEIGVWLNPGVGRSPLRPRGGQIPIILSTATPCHDPRPLQSWDMVDGALNTRRARGNKDWRWEGRPSRAAFIDKHLIMCVCISMAPNCKSFCKYFSDQLTLVGQLL